jgi:hypothetical protein
LSHVPLVQQQHRYYQVNLEPHHHYIAHHCKPQAWKKEKVLT